VLPLRDPVPSVVSTPLWMSMNVTVPEVGGLEFVPTRRTSASRSTSSPSVTLLPASSDRSTRVAMPDTVWEVEPVDGLKEASPP
jgi:hypothetical protein